MADAFQENINGVRNLVESNTNKVLADGLPEEGVSSALQDSLDLAMDDAELLELKRQWENGSVTYTSKISTRQDRNKQYYLGTQRQGETESNIPVPSNLIFESQETFIPQALAKNPEPVVWSDNTEEGKQASNDIKTMLQYHADTLCLRKKLGVMTRHWSIYYIGVAKHGWDVKNNEISTKIRKPKNFILDPDGFINEFGDFDGEYSGERIKSSARDLIALYPKAKDYITIKVNGKLGSTVTRTEWWTDDYCFVTFEDIVLDKHKNEFYNYDRANPSIDEFGVPHDQILKGQNHFSSPKRPYTFLSVFSLQEQPHDDTNLIEQNIANQDRINDRDYQIDRNLKSGNNSIAVSGVSFNSETAKQAAKALEDGDPVLVPDGQVENAIKRLPANDIPSAVFNSQQNDKETLRSVFGTSGLVPNNQPDVAVRNNILATQHDSSRIGGGVGDALEQVADNIFNWWLQLYYVFYDEAHYAAIMGSGQAVNYVGIQMTDQVRRFVVSVTPDSMQPKDEISEQNLAIDLANKGWLDPINLFKKLNYPDPMETAKMVTLYKLDPATYLATYFPESVPQQAMGQPGNPPDLGIPPAPVNENLSQDQASSSLSQVPINNPGLPQ